MFGLGSCTKCLLRHDVPLVNGYTKSQKIDMCPWRQYRVKSVTAVHIACNVTEILKAVV